MSNTRRSFLTLAGIAPLAVLAASRAGADPAPCYDPATLPLSQKNRRRGLGYVEQSADPKKHCAMCAFYTASKDGCGACQMLSGAAVNAGGLCSSFALKG